MSAVFIQCDNCSRNIHCDINNENGKDINAVFTKTIVFQNVGIL